MAAPCEQAVLNPKQELPDASELMTEASVTASLLDSDDYLCAQKCVFCQCIMTQKDGSKLLECLHPACDSCLRTPTNSSDIDLGEGRYFVKICPVCNVSSNPDKLIDNKLLAEITALQVNCETKCKNCADQIANDWCNECTSYICEACVTEHRSSRLCKHHTIMSKDEMFRSKENNPVIDSYFKCSIHPKELQEMYCNSCGEILCRDCTLVNHKNHTYNYIHDIAGSTRNELTSLIAKLRYRTDMARDGVRNVEVKNKLMQDKRVELHNQIQETVSEIVGFVKKAGENLMLEIDSECDKRKVANDSKAKALNESYVQGNYTTEFVSQALEMSTDKCLAYTKQRVMDHINRQLAGKPLHIPSPDFPVGMKLRRTFTMEKLKQVVVTALGQFVKFELGEPAQYLVHIPQPALNQQTFQLHQQQYQMQQQKQQQQQQQAWYNQQQQMQQPAQVSHYPQPYQQSVVHHQPSVLVSQQPHVIQGSSSGPLRSPQQQVTSSTDQQATSPLHSPHARTVPQHQSLGYGGLGGGAVVTLPPKGQQGVSQQQQQQQQQYWMQQQYHGIGTSQQQVPGTGSPHLKNILSHPQQPSALHHQQQGMGRMGLQQQQQQQVVRSQQQQQQQQVVRSQQQVMQQSHAARMHLHQQQVSATASPVSSSPSIQAKSWHIPQSGPDGSGGSAGRNQQQYHAAAAAAAAVPCGPGLTGTSLGGQNQKIHLPSRVELPKPLAAIPDVLRVTPHPPTPAIDSLRSDPLKEIASLDMMDTSGSISTFSSSKEDMAHKDISQGDKTVTSTAATPPASAAPSATPEPPSTSTQQEEFEDTELVHLFTATLDLPQLDIGSQDIS